MSKLRVLLTGAAGRVGRFLTPEFEKRFALRAFDRAPVPGVADSVRGDLSDLEALRNALQGIDVLVHLAANPDPFAKLPEELVAPNIVGCNHAFLAAADAGVRRVVYASSVQTVMGKPWLEPGTVEVDDPPRPYTLYGATKHFGEVLGRYYHDHRGLEVICVRLGGCCEAPALGFNLTGEGAYNWISPRDAVQLFSRAVETPGVPWAVVFGTSTTYRPYLSLRTAREILGYEPQDDVHRHLRKEAVKST
ncbi:MAG: NAD(P)-dependent oxidoreductase [Planctomycetes bacterium]|nr:NAD(P)-dependent oxidoreductase [Planctomycetota bacterium]